jgi:hypothetical protein
MKRLLALSILGALSGPALAADLGAQGGYKDDLSSVVGPCAGTSWTGLAVSTLVSSDIASASATGSDLSISYRNMTVGARLEYSTQLRNSPVVLGAFGEMSYNGFSDAINAGSLSESAGVTAGLVFGNVKPYISLSAEFADGLSQVGFGYGAGVEFKLGGHWVAALEGRRINWDTNGSWLNVDEDRFTGRVGYQF